MFAYISKVLITLYHGNIADYSGNYDPQHNSINQQLLDQQHSQSSLMIISFACNNLIYTTNTVKVHKVFKGQPLETVEVLTVGGSIGYEALMISHGLKLQKGNIGLFMLKDTC